ncbi:hypothetical protein GCM10028778_02030 [Barrientosiimonas marina]|uniref:Uncharacterized protein n=1 Tax=Lentibacillus kimchii TaxID=1542911 RepID=A0ABW2UP44_9BACI
MSFTSLKELLPASADGTYVVIFSSIVVLYILIRLFINWVIASNAIKLLSYLMTSFVMLISLLGGIVLTSMFQMLLLEEVLRSLAVFGGCLVLVHAVQHMFRNKKNRVQ